MSQQRTRSAGRPTLDQVAARAGVGRGTVSRVVNGSPQVSASARAAVEQAIDELGYVPNRAARALVTQRTDSVALVVSESEERVFGEPFFAGIIRGISSVLFETPLQLWLAMAQSPAEQDRVEHHLTPQHVDGVLLLSLHGDDPLPALLARRGLPVVLGGQPSGLAALAGEAELSDTHLSCVDADNEGGAQLAVEHLLSRGRRRIAAIAGPQDMGVGVARLAGYRRGLRMAGLPVEESMVGYGDFSEASGAAAMRALFARHPDIDAVYAASDLMAVGAMRVIKERGLRIPHDVAVVGFEDSMVARQTEPALSTVHQPVEAMGREMARLLVSHIRGDVVPSPLVVLDTHLVVRESS
ncbi:LacI family DNA-binding transcriptional regulator [Luedemannella flava]|uniref:LacI family DNA-binding transcriptional regulator n=1 Tax=Luedemannella flava TaxID=349316 RepID=A0ABN2MPP8_9ACTN